MATAVLIIRARLINMSDRPQFDNWYRTEQLPNSVRQFKAQRAWRCWSRTNPLVHLALYEFGTVEEAEASWTRPRWLHKVRNSIVFGERVSRARAKSWR